MKPHSFDPLIAKEVGIECAILLYNIEFWIEKNKANNKHFYDGKFWTYNSTKAFTDLFPYMTKDVIYKALQKLIKNGYLVKANFNQSAFDRTCWYALGDKMQVAKQQTPFCQTENSILPNDKMQVAKQQNDNNVSDINTDINHFKNTNKESVASKASEYSEDFEKFWGEYPRKLNKKLAFKAWNTCLKAKVNAELLISKAKEYAQIVKAKGTQEQYIKHAQSWLNGACYENDYTVLLNQQDKQRQAVMQRGTSNWGSNDDDGFF